MTGACRRAGCGKPTGINPRTDQSYTECPSCRQTANLKALTVARKRGQSMREWRERKKRADWNRPKAKGPGLTFATCPSSWWADELCQEDRAVFTHMTQVRLAEMRKSRFGALEELAYGPDEPPKIRRRKAIEECA